MPEAFISVPLRQCPGFTMNLQPGDVGHAALAFTGVYEPEGTETIARIAQMQGGLLVDVGANYGYYAILWCAQNPGNRCIAFEASPLVLPHLKENIRRNKLTERVHIIECAASRASGTVHFDTGPSDQTGWGGISNASGGENLVEVPAVRLDAVIDVPEIAMLKIDCEGADFWVLQGAEELLCARRVRHIFFEENPPRMGKLGIEPGSAERLVRVHGYQCVSFNGGAEYHAWIA